MRESISKHDQLTVFYRDDWMCRYCGEAVFFAQALKLLDSLNPNHGYYHPNGKSGAILPLFQWRWASVDHVVPVTKGGQNRLDNYVTSCRQCNLRLSNDTENRPSPNPKRRKDQSLRWDGLAGIYYELGPDDSWKQALRYWVLGEY